MRVWVQIICFVFFAFSINGQNYFVYKSDTINRIDSAGKKQGKWILLGQHKKYTCYKLEQKIEEGYYLNNRKTSVWNEYYCNGNLKNKLTFVNGRPNGYAAVYNENGTFSERGVWKLNRWIGTHYNYDMTGMLLRIDFFDSLGKYLDIKSIHLSEKGEVIQIEKLNETDSVKKKPSNFVYPFQSPPQLNGQHTLYNNKKQITKDGLFKENVLIDGKTCYYNENGLLTKLLIYKNGICVESFSAETIGRMYEYLIYSNFGVRTF